MLPAISIVSYIVLSIVVFSVENLAFISSLSLVAFLLLVFLPHRKLRRGIVPISIFLFATFFANALFTAGKIVFTLGPLTLTEEGLGLGTLRTLRVFLLIAAAKFLTLVTSLEEMIGAMGKMLSPLNRTGMPVKDFFDTMALSVRMLPLVVKRMSGEYSRQMHASGKRGIRARMEVVSRFLLPVFIESINDPETILHQAERGEKGDEKTAA